MIFRMGARLHQVLPVDGGGGGGGGGGLCILDETKDLADTKDLAILVRTQQNTYS